MTFPITTLIFDVGGVLIRTEDRRPRTMLADSFAMTYQELEDLFFNGERGHAAQRGEIGAAEHWEWVRKQLSLSPEEFASVRNTFFSGDVLDHRLLDHLRALKRDYTLAIITNAFDDARQTLTERFHLDEVFEPIFVSAEEGIMKPERRIYEIALARCGTEPAAAVFVDDFPQNVEGARAVGMQAIWFRDRESALQELHSVLNR